MKRPLSSLAIFALIAFAGPAAAGSSITDLPRLEFPGDAGPVVGQGCAAPATLTGPACPAPQG